MVSFKGRFGKPIMVSIVICALAHCDGEEDSHGQAGVGSDTSASQRPPSPEQVEAAMLNLQVRELASQRRTQEAYDVAQRAIELDRRVYGPGHKFVAQSLNNLAFLEMQLSRYEEARAHFEEAIRIQATALGTGHLEYARSLDNYGQLLRVTGRPYDAEYYHRRALAIREKGLPADDKDVIESVSNLGLSLTAQGKYADALPFVKRVHDRDRKLQSGPALELAHSTNALGYVYLRLRDLTRARPLLEDAMRMRTALGAIVEAAETETSIAVANVLAGQNQEALTHLKHAAPTLSNHFGESHAAMGGVHAELGRALRLGGDARAAMEELRQAQAIWATQLSKTTGDELARAQFGETLHAQETMSELCAARILAGNAGEAFIGVEEMRAAALAELLKSGKKPTKLLGGTDLRDVLLEGEAFLSIQWSTAAISAILVTKSEPVVEGVVVAGDVAKVERLNATARALAEKLHGPGECGRLALQLRNELFPSDFLARIETKGKVRRLVVAPDGVLSQLPIDLIINVPEVTYVPSASVFLGFRENSRLCDRNADAKGLRVLLVGPPEYGRWQLRKGVLESPKTRAESMAAVQMQLHSPLRNIEVAKNDGIRATALARGYDVVALSGDSATVANVEKAVRDKTIVHFLAHGRSGNRRAPYAASLALAAPEALTEEDFGFLTLERLVKSWSGKLESCQLVVLAACETQVGVPVGTNEFALPWGLLAAGSSAVVATLWPVDAEATNQFMNRFYESLLGAFQDPRPFGGGVYEPGKAMNKSEALAEAREWFKNHGQAGGLTRSTLGRERPIQSGPSIFSDPYYWAGFILVGEPE